MAILLYDDEQQTPEGDRIIWKVWGINESKGFPNGVKYSIVYLHKNKRILGYDNERSKGDHKHYFGKEEKYNFIDIDKLFDDFERDIEEVRRKLYGN